MMEKNGNTNRICSRCSNEVFRDNELCPACLRELEKAASESCLTLREAEDDASRKMEDTCTRKS